MTSRMTMRTMTGNPLTFALPIHAKEAGKLDTEKPSVNTSAMPRAIDIVPNVAIKGLIPRLVTSTPFTTPITAPRISPQNMANGIGMPLSSSIATTVEDSAMTDPTDRSNPPEASKIAMPMTMIAVGAIPTATARKLEKLKK